MAQTIYSAALSEADKKRLQAIAQTQGTAAASSLALQMANAQNTTTPTPQGATTPPTSQGAVTTPTNTGGAVPAQVQQAQQQAQAIRTLQEQQRQLQQAQQSGNIQAVNQILREQAQQQNIQSAQQSGNTQLAAQMQLAQAAEARAAALNSGATPAPVQNPYQAALAQATPQTTQPVQMKDYLFFGTQDPNFKLGMTNEDRASWDAIGRKYAAGDTSWNRDTNEFRENGNWSGYYDDNGNYNGWLRAVNGIGGYAPAFGGKVGETGYAAGTIFYAPDGKVYTMGADGSLTQSGNAEWAKYGSYIGPQAGYQDSSFWSLGDDGTYQRYTTQTAPDEVLEREGYYRDANGLVLPIDDQYRMAQAVKSGQITPEQAAMAQALQARSSVPASVLPSTQPVQTQPTQPTNTQPVTNYQPVQTQPTRPVQNTQQVQAGPAISNAPA